MLLNIQSGASPWSGCTGVFAAVIREILPDLRTSFRGISMQEVEIMLGRKRHSFLFSSLLTHFVLGRRLATSGCLWHPTFFNAYSQEKVFYQEKKKWLHLLHCLCVSMWQNRYLKPDLQCPKQKALNLEPALYGMGARLSTVCPVGGKEAGTGSLRKTYCLRA